MEIIEKISRIICSAEGVDPDFIGIGMGKLMPKDEEYPLWKARIKVAMALADSGLLK